MPKKQVNGNTPKNLVLDDYGIYRVSSLETAPWCPDSLRRIFQLVTDSQCLQMTGFGARRQRDDRRGIFDTNAAHDYDMALKKRADDLADRCSDPVMMDRPECTWVQLLSTRVFIPFDRAEEEKLDTTRSFHHCLACRRNFPPRSRPIIHTLNTRRTQAMRTAGPQHGESCRPDLELCESTDQHFNLPNFDIGPQLAYHDDDGDITGTTSIQIPDATLGLQVYDLGQEPWLQRKDLMDNDRVKLFDKLSLTETLECFELQGPYRKRTSKFVRTSCPMFGFGLWEAKKTTGGSHTDAFLQTARKLASLLRWQRKIFDTARCEDWCPLVWFFSSIGSSWEVSACYETKNSQREKYRYPMVLLWSGQSASSDGALQLLYIIDIIRFWAEHTYKPTIGTCLSRLQAIKAGRPSIPFEDTLWKSRIAINETNTPWLFHQQNLSKASSTFRSSFNDLGIPQVEAPSHRRSSDQPHLDHDYSPTSRQSSGRINQRNLTPIGERYIIPEIENYNWILDRDPGLCDLLLIRIDRNGKIRRPIILFDSVDWKDKWDEPNFQFILADEMQRHNPDILPRFTMDKRGCNYLWNCGRSKFPYIRSDTQFCAIIPLDLAKYDRQQPKPDECQLFEPLESLLDIPALLSEIDRAYGQWCSCSCSYTEYSPSMILCCNAKCSLGWYHLRCVGLDEDDDRIYWWCDTCRDIPDNERTDIKLIDSDTEYDKTVEASDYRVQRTRTLRRAWNKHPWPSTDAILRKFQKVTLNLDIVKSAAYTIHRQGVKRNLPTPRYWVLSKDKPRKLIMASSREKQLVYHEEVVHENGDDSDDADENEIYSNEEAVDGIEDALESMSLSQGRASPGRGIFG